MVEFSLQVFNALPTVSALFLNSKFSFTANDYMFNLNWDPNVQESTEQFSVNPESINLFINIFTWSTNSHILKKIPLLYCSRLQNLLFLLNFFKIKNHLIFADDASILKSIRLMLPLCICITPHKQNTADLKDDKWAAQNMEKLAAAARKLVKKPKCFRHLPMENESNEERTEKQQQIMNLRQRNGKHLH